MGCNYSQSVNNIFQRMILSQRNALILLISFSLVNTLLGQDLQKVTRIVDTLASPAMYGRGYVNNGSNIAAEFIAVEMKAIGLIPLSRDYKQPFYADVKTYPNTVDLKIDNKVLKAGIDFALITGSPSVCGTFQIQLIDSDLLKSKRKIQRIIKRDLSNTFIMYNPSEVKGKAVDSLMKLNYSGFSGFIRIIEKGPISWSVASSKDALVYPVLTVLKSSLPPKPKNAEICIELKEFKNFELNNVAGYIPGTAVPDSFVVVTSHHDHLGMLGKSTYFPGANDNASGTAMMLDMASHYSQPQNRMPFSMVFISFAGEELGLKGSTYCSESSLLDLKRIRFLINLDMVGTGSEGITVVNAVQLPEYYNRLVSINEDKGYLSKVTKRGESCNSDHCPFYQKGVPAFFIYSNGKEHLEYHNINDRAKLVPFTEYEDIFRLVRDFINTL